MILFPDANLFLQFRDPAELPWGELVGDFEEIRLLVCRTVQSEIDSLKGDGRDRRAERARKASSRFRDIIMHGESIMLREHGPRVTLDLAPRVRPGYPHPATLDLSGNDDRIVAETMAHAAETREAVALLTADTGPMLTARDHGLAYYPLPDGWRLPKEADDRDKQIKELTRQLAELRHAAPELVVAAATEEGPLSGSLTITLLEHPALTPDVVDHLVERLRARYPMRTDFSAEANPKPSSRASLAAGVLCGLSSAAEAALSGLGTWTPPSEAAITRYQEEAYPRWLEGVRSFLMEVDACLSAPHRHAAFAISLANTGMLPAEGLLIEIEALGGLLLAKRSRTAEAERPPLALPGPPEPPAWRMVARGGLPLGVTGTVTRAQGAEVALPFLLHDLASAQWDPHAFYWRDQPGKEPRARWDFQCQEFRHGVSEIFNVVVVAPPAFGAESGAVRFTASARNLPRRVMHVVPVRIERRLGDTGAEAEALMPLDRSWRRAR